MFRKRVFRITIAIAAAIALALPLIGCQTESSSQSDALHVWLRDSDTRNYIDKVFEIYETETGNKIDKKIVPEEDFDEEIENAFKNGNAPDVLLHYNDSDLSKLGIEDNFLALNDQGWVDSLMSGARTYCDDGKGNIIGLPFWESSISGCYYNKTILSNLGLKPASTQAEFDMLCQAIKSTGSTPLFWGTECGWMYQFGLDPIFSDNPDLLEKLNNGEINYADIPQVHDMVQWIYDAYQSGWLGDPIDKTLEDVSKPMASGDTVMVDIWDTWFEEDFAPAEYSVDDFAIMPIFMGTSNEGTYEGGNLNMMLVNKNSKHIDEALGFLEFCAQPEVFNRAFDGVPSAKVFKDQNTIITSDMIVNASSSIEKLERASTANPKIHGYSQKDMMVAFTALFKGEVGVDGCITIMDDLRKTSMNQ